MKRRSFLTVLAALPTILLGSTKWLSGKARSPVNGMRVSVWTRNDDGSMQLHRGWLGDGSEITIVASSRIEAGQVLYWGDEGAISDVHP